MVRDTLRTRASLSASGESSRNVTKWTVAALLFVAMVALLTSLSLFQITAEGPAKQTLRRSVAALTEIDVLTDRHYDDLQQSARAAKPDESVRLEGFPIDVPLAPGEVLDRSREDIRATILDRSADDLYRTGTSVLRGSANGKGNVGRFSVSGLTDDGLGFLRHRNHTAFGILTFALAAICAGLSLLLACVCRGFGRLVSVGAVVLAAAAPFAAVVLGARLYMRVVADGDTEYLQGEVLAIGRAMIWIPIRDSLGFVVLGAAFLALGIAGAIVADRRASAGADDLFESSRVASREASVR